MATSSFCLIDRPIGRVVLMCIEAAQSFLILEWNRKENKQEKVNNKGICRVKASSFVALLSLSVETFLQERTPWSRYAETADPIIPSNIEGAWVCVEMMSSTAARN